MQPDGDALDLRQPGDGVSQAALDVAARPFGGGTGGRHGFRDVGEEGSARSRGCGRSSEWGAGGERGVQGMGNRKEGASLPGTGGGGRLRRQRRMKSAWERWQSD